MTAFYFAHVGEAHETVTQAASHSLLGRWYIALALFMFLMAVLTTATYHISRKSKPVTYTVMLFVLFIVGVATYKLSAVVSVIALSLGFAMALLQVLIGLSAQHD